LASTADIIDEMMGGAEAVIRKRLGSMVVEASLAPPTNRQPGKPTKPPLLNYFSSEISRYRGSAQLRQDLDGIISVGSGQLGVWSFGDPSVRRLD
jgi:hypothetical protein